MKRSHLIVVALCAFVVGLFYILSVYFSGPKKKAINWTETYSNEDKIPYGAYVFYNMLSSSFQGYNVNAYNKPLDKLLTEPSILEKKTNLFIVNYYFSPDLSSTKQLCQYVSLGNNAFISAYFITGELAEKLNIKTSAVSNPLNLADSSPLNFINPNLLSKRDYQFKFSRHQAYFSFMGKGEVSILGTLGKNQAINFIRIKYGEGYFYLNTAPYAFSNIGMLAGRNWAYAMKCISYLPVRDAIWEDKTIVSKGEESKRASDSPLTYILSQPSLKVAYYLLLGLILLYILFEGKRKQKIIPVVPPIKNTTLDFAETIGRLYFNKHDNKNLAQKKITFFMDYIRSRFFIRNTDDVDLVTQLSMKSGISEAELKSLFNTIEYAKNCETLSDHDLMVLNNKIDEFYKNTSLA